MDNSVTHRLKHTLQNCSSITVRLLQTFPSTYWTVCSRSSMQQHVSFTKPASTTTCLYFFRYCIGFLFLNASNTGWLYCGFVCLYDMTPEYIVRDLQTPDSVSARRPGSSWSAKDQTFHCRRSCFWCRCCSYLEQSTSDSDLRCNTQ